MSTILNVYFIESFLTGKQASFIIKFNQREESIMSV